MARTGLIVVALTLVPTLALAQDATDLERRLDEQERRLQELTQEVETLRADAEASPDDEGAGDADSLEVGEPDGNEADAEDHWTQKIELGLFYIRSTDGDHELEFSGRVHFDGRFQLKQSQDHILRRNQFIVRRARFTVSGNTFRYFGYKISMEFGVTSDADIRDAWIQFKPIKEAQLWVGQMIVPFSTQRLRSSKYIKHPERGILIAASNDRDIGGQLYGEVADKKLIYWIGLYNGPGKNLALETDDDKDVAFRVEAHPIDELTFATAYVYTPNNRSAIGPRNLRTVGNTAATFLNYTVLSNRRLKDRQRFMASMMLTLGPVELSGEFVLDYHRKVITPTQRANLLNWSYVLDASWMITGEDEGDKIKPNNPIYDGEEFGFGAFELSARYERFVADPETTRLGFATGTDKVDAFTGTLSWYLVSNVRFMFSYTFSHFDERVPDRDGDLHHNDHFGLVRAAIHF